MLDPPGEDDEGRAREDLGPGSAPRAVSCRSAGRWLASPWSVSGGWLGVSSLLYRDTIMAPPRSVEAKRKYFSVEEANKTLPLVKAIVTDIVHQFHVVTELKQRLSAVVNDKRRTATDPYSEELAQSQAELE